MTSTQQLTASISDASNANTSPVDGAMPDSTAVSPTTATALSTESTDAESYSPAPTTMGQASPHVSVMAVHGSAPTNTTDNWLTPGQRVRDRLPKLASLAKFSVPLDPVLDTAGAPQPGTPDFDAHPTHMHNNRVIVLDFDDVMCQSMLYSCLQLNERFGEQVSPDDMHSSIYFQNKGWGTPAQSMRRARLMDNLPATWPAIPALLPALQALRALGRPLHIVTARSSFCSEAVEAWLADKGISVGDGPHDHIVAVWYAGSYGDEDDRAKWAEQGDTASAIEREGKLNEQVREQFKQLYSSGSVVGSKKVQIMKKIDARLLIDDGLENCQAAATADPPIQCILFGAYAWNRAHSQCRSPSDFLSFEERQVVGGQLDPQPFEATDGIKRASGWHEVLELVKKWDEEDV